MGGEKIKEESKEGGEKIKEKIEEKIEKKKEELIEGVAKEATKQPDVPKMREILLQFDSQRIIITKAEVASNFEFQAILENVLKKVAPTNQ